MRPSVVRRNRCFSFFFVCLLSFFITYSVFAKDLKFEEKGCDNLDLERIARLVEIELSETQKPDIAEDRLSVYLECHGDKIDVSLLDSVTNSTLKRSIDPKDQKVNERVVALSISQLISVFSIESKKQDTPKEKDSLKPKEVVEITPIKEEEKQQSHDRDLFITGGGKLRSGTSLPVVDVGLKGDLLFTSNLGAAFLLGFETGSTGRDAGTVRTMAFFGGVGAVGRFFRSDMFFLEVGIEALMGYAYLRADPNLWASGKSAGGMTGEFALLAAPTFIVKRMLLSIHVKGGYTVENPVGFIAGEKDITIGGGWAGIDLGVGLRFGSDSNR